MQNLYTDYSFWFNNTLSSLLSHEEANFYRNRLNYFCW